MRCSFALVVLAACSATRFDGALYRGDGFAFRIPETPAHWAPLEHSAAALAWRDDDARGTVMINARCGLDGDEVPLTALTQHLFLDFTEREVELEETVPFDGREARHTVMRAKLDGVALKFDVWVLKKDGCVYDLLYLAPGESFEQGRESFAALVRGFHTVSLDDG